MTDPSNSLWPAALRKPRLLWANAYCLLDTSSGASMAVREMLRQLVAHGYEVEVVGAMVFDHPRGTLKLQPQWATVQACMGGVLTIDDDPLTHRLIVTASTERDHMTSKEEASWLGLYEKVLASFKPDVVLFYGGQVLERLIAAEAKARGVPVVAYLANASFKGKNWCRDVDLFLTTSQTCAAMYARTEAYTAIPVGVFIEPSAVIASHQTRERVLLVNPSAEKGVGILIQLALLLETRRPDIVFEVIESRGNWQVLLVQFSQAVGTRRDALSNVVVTPNTSDMRPFFGRARLLLAPSLWWETAGRVVGEAMLNGIPAIVCDHGGLPEMMQDGGIKLKLPPRCHEAPYNVLPALALLEPLADTIIRFYDDEAFYADFSARAYRVGQTHHSLSANTHSLVQALAPWALLRAGDQVSAAAVIQANSIPLKND